MVITLFTSHTWNKRGFERNLMANQASAWIQSDGSVPDWKWMAWKGRRKGKPEGKAAPRWVISGYDIANAGGALRRYFA
jgi:hypothetical protein